MPEPTDPLGRSSALLLAGAAAAGLIWANSPWQDAYDAVWTTSWVQHLVNDGLLTVFFFVIGLEIKRELAVGELADRRVAALPVFAALGGMVVPVALYLAVAGGGDGARGWGIPMATDIAFTLGVLRVLGSRVPRALELFLLTLAVVDDIGAVVVIGVFYAGIHATIAGVAVALIIPVGRAERLERRLNPVSNLLVLPLFALANAGVHLRSGMLSPAGAGAVVGGIVLGLVVGKAAGILLGAWIGVRLGVATRPAELTWWHLAGGAALGGIGFTVSLFVAGLAFADHALVDAATVGVLGASLTAAAIGSAVLVIQSRRA